MYVGLDVTYLLFCQISTNLESFRHYLVKFPITIFLKIDPAVADLFHSEGRTSTSKLTAPSLHLRDVIPFGILLEYSSIYLQHLLRNIAHITNKSLKHIFKIVRG
jgi:hypothetical protein